MSFDEISLANRVLALRESSEDTTALSSSLRRELSFSESEANATATALADRFISPEEQLDMLGYLELHGSLAEGSTVSGFIGRLAGSDGNEATRHRVLTLADRLTPASVDGERTAVSDESFRELAAALPRTGVPIGGISPMTYGMYTYLRPADPAMSILAAELRSNWESSTDPILRMRSARVIAESGDSRAAAFLRDSVASFSPNYSGELSIDERISRAAGLAVDGNEAAARFLQNVAMNPREILARRTRALEYLPPSSLDNGSDTIEVFRSLVEDPEEPITTRYLMMSVLARSPNPPDPSWWRRRIDDPTMLVTDRASSGAASAAGNTGSEFSQWNLTIAALGSSHSDFASVLLRDVIHNRGVSIPVRREALMAYIHQNGRGTLSWDTLREVLALPPGEWDGILTEVADGVRPLRLRFPRSTSGSSGLGSSESVDTEIVLQVNHGGGRGWEVEFRPLDRARDPLVAASEPGVYEAYVPENRRMTLDGISSDEIETEVYTPTPTGPSASGRSGDGGPSPDAGSHQNASIGGSTPGI